MALDIGSILTGGLAGGSPVGAMLGGTAGMLSGLLGGGGGAEGMSEAQLMALINAQRGGGGGGGAQPTMPGYNMLMDTLLQRAPQFRQYAMDEQEQAINRLSQNAYNLGQTWVPAQQQQALRTARWAMPQWANIYQNIASQDRASTMRDIERLGPRMQGARESAEMPQTTAMRQALMGQVGNELSMGASLTPEQAREAQQASRSAMGARGINSGMGGSAREAVQSALEGQRLQSERQQKAMGALNQEYQASPNPFSTVMGMPSTSGQATQMYQGGIQAPNMVGEAVSGLGLTLPASQHALSFAQSYVPTPAARRGGGGGGTALPGAHPMQPFIDEYLGVNRNASSGGSSGRGGMFGNIRGLAV